MPQYTKLDDNTLLITVTPKVTPQVSTYKFDDLVANVQNLKDAKAASDASFDSQIADAQALVDAATGLGIVSVATAAKPADVANNNTAIPAQQ